MLHGPKILMVRSTAENCLGSSGSWHAILVGRFQGLSALPRRVLHRPLYILAMIRHAYLHDSCVNFVLRGVLGRLLYPQRCRSSREFIAVSFQLQDGS